LKTVLLFMANNLAANQLLAALPLDDQEAIKPRLEEVSLTLDMIVMREGAAFDKLYFPASGVISTVAVFANGVTVEMATTGREGMVGVGAILGSEHSLSQQVVQVPGSALTMAYPAFRLLLRRPAFQRILSAYARAFLMQVLQTVACNVGFLCATTGQDRRAFR
jgi:hypothetical protein